MIADASPISPPRSRRSLSPADRAEVAALQAAMNDQLERAATHAFQRAFLVGGLLALLALIPAALLRDARREPEPPTDPDAPTLVRVPA